MAKFLILYNSKEPASDRMANSTPEQMQASMAEWISWRDEASQSVEVEFGMPLQSVGQVKSDAGPSNISGYSFLKGDKETVMRLVNDHPHLKSPGASIEVLEVLTMPGLPDQA